MRRALLRDGTSSYVNDAWRLVADRARAPLQFPTRQGARGWPGKQQRRQRCPRRTVLKVVVVVVVVDRVPLESAQHELKGPRIVNINLCLGSSTRRQVFAIYRLLLNFVSQETDLFD